MGAPRLGRWLQPITWIRIAFEEVIERLGLITLRSRVRVTPTTISFSPSRRERRMVATKRRQHAPALRASQVVAGLSTSWPFFSDSTDRVA
jgi:hypothetical protein